MSHTAYNISNAVKRLRDTDFTLEVIWPLNKTYTDEDLVELIDCLLIYPNVVTEIFLRNHHLTDKTGVKLATFIATSKSIEKLTITGSQIGELTYLAIADALRVNTSLGVVCLYDSLTVDKPHIEARFVDALILNPNRPIGSRWYLYKWNKCKFERLNRTAEKLGHPNMQSLLALLAIY